MSGAHRVSPGGCTEYGPKFSGIRTAEHRVDPSARGLLLAHEALGVDLEQDGEAVAGPLGNLSGEHTGIEPRRHRGVPARAGRRPDYLADPCPNDG